MIFSENGEIMESEAFKQLITIIRFLQGPQGCPWDREQTLKSMRSALLEETYEVLEAIDLEDNNLLEEELGDLFFATVFLSLLAEKEHKCKFDAILKRNIQKLIRRHPHIFGKELVLNNSEEALRNWEKIKKEEYKETRKSVLDGIPKDLPSLAKTQKTLRKLKNVHSSHYLPKKELTTEEELGKELFELVERCVASGVHAEHALRKYLTEIEREFRKNEIQEL